MIYNDVRIPKREIKIGSISIGGKNKIALQSMTNTDTHDAAATYTQVKSLSDAGCDIIRITVPDVDAAKTISYLKEKGIRIPIVADIHFDYKAAIAAAECGADKIRINPGNIGSDDKVKEVCRVCSSNSIPIRIGVNSGSLEKHILEKYGSPSATALAESALYHISLFQKFDFYNIAVSIKSSDVKNMIDANVILSNKCDYPLHLGVTEAGAGRAGLIKSSAGIGALLCRGIGDTIRVSLTDDPIEEVRAAKELLTVLDIEGQRGLNIISCPTCGRTSIDLIGLYRRFTDAVRAENLTDMPITIALMGCIVNGPGEAREADIGIAGGKGEALLFKKGVIIGKINEEDIVETLINELRNIT